MRSLLLVLVPLLLLGCAKGTSDLQQWVNEVKARRGQPIEPLPVIRTFETFLYESEEMIDGELVTRRDPFRPSTDELPQEDDEGTGLRPDPNRRRELLEAYPLDALAMVGTLGESGDMRALIRAPDRVIHRVVPGNYLGQNYGRITEVLEHEVRLVELVRDSEGVWQERKASIALSEK